MPKRNIWGLEPTSDHVCVTARRGSAGPRRVCSYKCKAAPRRVAHDEFEYMFPIERFVILKDKETTHTTCHEQTIRTSRTHTHTHTQYSYPFQERPKNIHSILALLCNSRMLMSSHRPLSVSFMVLLSNQRNRHLHALEREMHYYTARASLHCPNTIPNTHCQHNI